MTKSIVKSNELSYIKYVRSNISSLANQSKLYFSIKSQKSFSFIFGKFLEINFSIKNNNANSLFLSKTSG
ncbi:hypothetical protein GW891_03050 [bacterium]|nr:hypothetical protein [bacterium]